MKRTLYIITTMLLFCSCNEATTETNPVAETFESPLVFNLDYEGLEMHEEQSFDSFKKLFEYKKTIRLDNASIRHGEDKVYHFSQNLGDVLIEQVNDQEYTFLEHYIIPIGSVYGKFALMRYTMNAKTGALVRDKTFEPQLAIYKYWSNHVVKEYDDYLTNPSFTNKDVEAVPHAALDAMRFLMFNLTLAVILEDCEACADRMARITEDYAFVQKAAYYGQNLEVCQTILKKFSH